MITNCGRKPKTVDTRNPEDHVIDEIDRLVDDQLRLPQDDYNAPFNEGCPHCGGEWHGLPKLLVNSTTCPGAWASDEDVQAWREMFPRKGFQVETTALSYNDGAWRFSEIGCHGILAGLIDLNSSTFKVALYCVGSNVQQVNRYSEATNEHSCRSGYVTGGLPVSLAVSRTRSGCAVSFAANPVWSAVGQDLFVHYAALYDWATDEILCTCAIGPTSCTAGNTLTIDSDGCPNPVFSLTI